MRRKRRSTPPAVFEDPLKDYSPPKYEDELERSLCEDRVDVIKTRPFTTIDADTPIEQALRTMAELDVACLLITERDHLVGIFSERDVLFRVAHQYEQIKGQPVREVMTGRPAAVYETDTPAKAINLMATGGFRHVPILNIEERVVGIIGPRRVTAYLQNLLTETAG